MTLRLSDAAFVEYADAFERYLIAGNATADRFAEAFLATLNLIERSPLLFPVYTAAPTRKIVRHTIVPRFPYVVLYQIEAPWISIIAVAHASRTPGYWEERS
ncbi:MAG: type II toxin-antitoxin system RelE/ParE family toxin [Planctomycetota bacterium]